MSDRINSATKLPVIHPGPGSQGRNRFQPGEKAKNSKTTLLRLLQLYKSFSFSVAGAIILTLISSLVAVGIPYFSGQAFDSFDGLNNLIDGNLLYTTLFIILALQVISWLTNSLSSLILLFVSQKLIFNLRQQFFNKMQKLPLIYYDTNPHGDIMSRLSNDADNVSSSITSATTQLLASLLTIVSSVVIMLSLSIWLTLTILLAVPLVYTLTTLIAKKSKNHFYRQQVSLGQLNSIIEENILGIKIVKAFGKQTKVADDFLAANQHYYQDSFKAQVYSGAMMPLMNVINNLIFALIALVGGYLVVTSSVSVGVVVSFLSYSKQFAHPLNNIAGMFNTIQQSLASAERIFETLDEAEETADSVAAICLENPKGNIIFDKVYFSYVPGTPVLKGVSFKAKAGKKIAIVGETGSGKTTIINLLNRFYDIDSGNIYLDGSNIKDIKRAELRHYFSVVLQETSLFTATIMDNIRYSRNTATDEEVVQAAKIAHADDFITRLPQAYQTLVSGANDSLSEGQKQLIAIARAVLSHSPILILDEATSFVDTKTEKDIQKALVSLQKNRTSFLIAHRLSTIKDCDTILLIKDGVVAESGNHNQLMKKRGIYYQMVIAQMGLDFKEN